MLTLTDTQKCILTATAVDAKGNAATGSTIVWTSSDPTVVTITPLTPNTAEAFAVGPLGTVIITATADAGVATLQVEVIVSAAVALAIFEGVPTEQ